MHKDAASKFIHLADQGHTVLTNCFKAAANRSLHPQIALAVLKATVGQGKEFASRQELSSSVPGVSPQVVRDTLDALVLSHDLVFDESSHGYAFSMRSLFTIANRVSIANNVKCLPPSNEACILNLAAGPEGTIDDFIKQSGANTNILRYSFMSAVNKDMHGNIAHAVLNLTVGKKQGSAPKEAIISLLPGISAPVAGNTLDALVRSKDVVFDDSSKGYIFTTDSLFTIADTVSKACNVKHLPVRDERRILNLAAGKPEGPV